MSILSDENLKNVSGGKQPKFDGHVCVDSGWAPTCPTKKRKPSDVGSCGLCENFRRLPDGVPKKDNRDGYCIVQ